MKRREFYQVIQDSKNLLRLYKCKEIGLEFEVLTSFIDLTLAIQKNDTGGIEEQGGYVLWPIIVSVCDKGDIFKNEILRALTYPQYSMLSPKDEVISCTQKIQEYTHILRKNYLTSTEFRKITQEVTQDAVESVSSLLAYFNINPKEAVLQVIEYQKFLSKRAKK